MTSFQFLDRPSLDSSNNKCDALPLPAVCTPIANSVQGAAIQCTSATDSTFVNPNNACLAGYTIQANAGSADTCVGE